MSQPIDRRQFLEILAALSYRARRQHTPAARDAARTPGHHVYPNQSIQDALDQAARDPVNRTVYVHAGTYRPAAKGQALVWLNARMTGSPWKLSVRSY